MIARRCHAALSILDTLRGDVLLSQHCHGGQMISDLNHLQTLTYAMITVSIILFLRSYTLMHAGTRVSEFYHSRMLSTVMRAPVLFFDTTSSGQFLVRFGKEVETIDHSVPDSITSVLYRSFRFS